MVHKYNIYESRVITRNERICSGSDPSGQFNWDLTNNDKELNFYFGKINIDILIVSNSHSDPVKLLLMYVC